jgi:hypothetical protein
MIDLNNFYLATFGNFKRCKVPKRKPDFFSLNKVTGKVSSRYWYGQDSEGLFVVRLSDHWGKVASCRWLLGGTTENFPYHQCGKTYCSAMKALDL